MSIGTYLSGTGHAALVVWMIVGWGMSADPVPFEVMDVSVVSGAEFAALSSGARPDLPPQPETVDPAVIDPPPVDETPPAPTEQPAPAPPDVPAPVAPLAPDAPPVAPDVTVPDAVVTDTPPDAPEMPTIVAPPPSAEVGDSARPVPRPAARVAPEIVSPPPPDATVAPDVAQSATEQPEAPSEQEVQAADETTAPEAAADQIVTEAEEPTFAPQISLRPQLRPIQRAVVVPEETPVDPVAAALAAAGVTDTPTATPEPNPTATPAPTLSGGQLSDGDKTGFLRQIGGCWNVGSMSTAAQNTVIVMTFDMAQDGKPISGSEQMASFSGGAAADAEVVFRTARSALFRCTREGYDLPRDQFAQWQRVELTVDPTQMRLR